MEIQGKIIAVLPIESGVGKTSGKQWSKQTFVIETIDQYPKKIAFSLMGDRISKYPLQLEQYVNVSFDVSSREYNGRWFTEASAWRIERVDNTQPQQVPTQQAYQPQGILAQNQYNTPAPQPQYAQTPAPAMNDLPF